MKYIMYSIDMLCSSICIYSPQNLNIDTKHDRLEHVFPFECGRGFETKTHCKPMFRVDF